ncbi:hypothetical protein [Spiroplasma endosymbiont of Amphimallon solstitiale]|uniref:hypothetical protein n=1 Tax=Spiroplasma endosymbiont of Amphimallon solstitiale TaxID=3066288 RepID=UPI00313EF25B
MINKLWTDVSLENYNNWYPLTGKITETPQQYINTWPNVNDWFITFAIRAQNDINAYLNFILSKFPFDSFKDELIKETLRDMVYVMVEHWVFNRTPIEFNVDTTIQFNNGNQFSASSIPTINVWDLAPSRMKIWARLTELKQVFLSYNQDEIDIEKIDLQAFYTRNQVDELIKEQKEFTLSKQMKLYDDLIDDNENEIYRGHVTNFINKGYVATEYDPKTETMILDWPDEIGTLPPEALQNNPQIGDFTHAPTCDFSAKQQKRITTNENNITKLNDELTKTNEIIDDIKNNWFNIETSPLWKQIDNKDLYTNQWYIVPWTYVYFDSKQLSSSVSKLTKVIIEYNLTKEQMFIIVEKIIVEDNINITLSFDFNTNKFIVQTSSTKYKGWLDNDKLYQYKGIGTPTEFIVDESVERDYYTKNETNDLLDKKQNINDDNLQTVAKLIVPAINENKTNIDKKQDKIDDLENKIFNNKEDKNNATNLVNNVIKVGVTKTTYYNDPVVTDDLDIPNKKYIDDKLLLKQNKLTAGTNITIDKNNVISASGGGVDPNNYYTKPEVDKKLEDKVDIDKFSYAFTVNALGTENPNIETTNKTIVGAINELKQKINDKKFSNDYFKYNTETNEVSLNDEENSLLCKDLLENNEYKLLKTQNKKLLQAINEILEKQPQPSPSDSNWKDVAFSQDRETIIYELKPDTHYRIFYDVSDKRSTGLIGKYPTLISEFYWKYLNETTYNDLWINLPHWVNGILSHLVIIINKYKISWYRNSNDGNFWKLQELQE